MGRGRRHGIPTFHFQVFAVEVMAQYGGQSIELIRKGLQMHLKETVLFDFQAMIHN